jgi:hypothetical protein
MIVDKQCSMLDSNAHVNDFGKKMEGSRLKRQYERQPS